jgi:hypothetical protein
LLLLLLLVALTLAHQVLAQQQLAAAESTLQVQLRVEVRCRSSQQEQGRSWGADVAQQQLAAAADLRWS